MKRTLAIAALILLARILLGSKGWVVLAVLVLVLLLIGLIPTGGRR